MSEHALCQHVDPKKGWCGRLLDAGGWCPHHGKAKPAAPEGADTDG